jgi:Kef-type K+ transport system membrane component KefB
VRAAPPKKRIALIYVATVGIPLGVLLAVLAWGGGMAAPPALSEPLAWNTPRPNAWNLALLMAQIGSIILLARVMGAILEKLGQPRVIGEMLAGILLGPSFFGWLAPGAWEALFPASGFGVLNALSQVGLVLFLFMVGLELDVKELRNQGHVAVLVSHASIAAPMACGAALAIYLYPRISDGAVNFSNFALFLGVAMSITAFPVLARILSEQRLLRSPTGTLAIACAAIDDVTGWCILAVVVALVRASHSALPVWGMVAGLALFLAVMIAVVRPLLRGVERHYAEHGELSDNYKAVILLVLLASAVVTESLGLHLLFGAFLAGAIMPKNPELVSYIVERFESITVLLLMPLFFAYTGLRTRLGSVSGWEMWGLCLLIIGVAVAGKLGGTSVAARMSGLGWRESLSLGALMNTRGLMELVVLNIGLDIQVISPQLFSMMVVMAIVTTMMTPPLMLLLGTKSAEERRAEGRLRSSH